MAYLPPQVNAFIIICIEYLHFAKDFAQISHTPTHVRKDVPSQHLRITSRLEDLPKEDKGDDVECDKPITCQSERRRSTNDR